VVEDLLLGHAGRDVERALHAQLCRHVGEQVLDRIDADRPEHLLAVGIRG